MNNYFKPAGDLEQNLNLTLEEQIKAYLINIVNNNYINNISDNLIGAGSIITSFTNLKQMVDEGCYRFTKAEYLNLLNNMYPDLVTFRKTESVDKASVVIADYVSTSSKYRAGKSKGKLFTSLEFLCEVLNKEKLTEFLNN